MNERASRKSIEMSESGINPCGIIRALGIAEPFPRVLQDLSYHQVDSSIICRKFLLFHRTINIIPKRRGNSVYHFSIFIVMDSMIYP